MELTGNVRSYTESFLNLEHRASEPYNRFVFSSLEQSLTVRQFLFERDLCEFSPPYSQLVLNGHEAVGMIAYLTADELNRSRLRAAFALAKSEFFKQDKFLQSRLQLAGATLIKLQSGDFYLSRIAVSEASHGLGIGRFLMNHFEAEARRRGCRNMVLEVDTANDGARKLYRQQQFQEADIRRVVDPDSGRSLEYLHMTKHLT